MSDLVQRLSHGVHPVEVGLRDERTVKGLKECLDRGYIHVKFTGTRGGTELGFSIDKQQSELDADFEGGTGHLRLIGQLTLDYTPVRCVAEISLPSLEGTGHLEPLLAQKEACRTLTDD